jgi:hypothetical protein
VYVRWGVTKKLGDRSVQKPSWPTLKTHHNNEKAKFAKAVETLTYTKHRCITKLKHVKNPQVKTEINSTHGNPQAKIEINSIHGELPGVSFCATRVANYKGQKAKAQFI